MSASICGPALIAILTSDCGGGPAVRSAQKHQQDWEKPHFNSSSCDSWIIGRLDNICMADITVWTIMCSHTHSSTCMHTLQWTHTFINLCNWTGWFERERGNTGLLYLNHHRYLSPFLSLSLSPSHTHTHTVLILPDRNTDVSKPWG